MLQKLPADKDKYYIDPEALKHELYLYQHDTNPIKVPSDALGITFMQIAHNYARHHYFYNYTDTFKEEMIGMAIQNMVEKIDNCKLDHPKSNPFFFFSRITYNAFRKFVKMSRRRLTAEYDARELQWSDFCSDNRIQNNLSVDDYDKLHSDSQASKH